VNGEYPSIVPELSLYRVEAELAATQAELAGADKVISNLKVLCQRAADALEFIDASRVRVLHVSELIAELREAGK